jgi:hypothetical protein
MLQDNSGWDEKFHQLHEEKRNLFFMRDQRLTHDSRSILPFGPDGISGNYSSGYRGMYESGCTTRSFCNAATGRPVSPL